MKSHVNQRFREAFSRLPDHVRRHAMEAYKLFQENPGHAGLQFKRVHPTRPIYSARITMGYRALGVRDGEEIVWFWIGSHADYDRMISQK
ncbi:MAG: hypothetical protein V2A73_00780 [Pseudomonadota bacterium]